MSSRGQESCILSFSNNLSLCFEWCFLRPTWLHIPGCLPLGEWSHHHHYLCYEDLSVEFFCVFLPHLLNVFCFCLVPIILTFIESIFAWNVPSLSQIILKRSLVFSIIFFPSISLHWSLRKSFLSLHDILWNTAFKWEYISFSPLFFASVLFTDICKTYSDSHFAFGHFFSLGIVLIPISCTMEWTSVHSPSGTLSVRSSPLSLFLTSTI